MERRKFLSTISAIAVTAPFSLIKTELFPLLSNPKEKEVVDSRAIKYFFDDINSNYGLPFEKIYDRFLSNSYIRSKFIQFLADKDYQIVNPTEHQKVIQIVEFSLENGHMFFKDESFPFRSAEEIRFEPFPTMKLGIKNKLTHIDKNRVSMYTADIPKNIGAGGLTIQYNSQTIICLIDKKNGIQRNKQGAIIELSNQASIVLHNEYMHKFLIEKGFKSISQCGSFRDQSGNEHQSLSLLELITQNYSYQSACDPNHEGWKHDLGSLAHDYINKRDNLELENKTNKNLVNNSGYIENNFNESFLPKEQDHQYMKGLLYFNKVLSEEIPTKYNIFWNDIHKTINRNVEKRKARQISTIVVDFFDTISNEEREKIEHKLMLKIDETMELLERNELTINNK